MLVEGRPAQDADQVFSNLAIICFNYDRCVEQFLIHWRARAYALQFEEVRPLLAKLPILRPYGKIGHDGKRYLGIAFGEEPGRLQFVDLASGIRTYTQQVEDDALVKEIRRGDFSALSLFEILQKVRPGKGLRSYPGRGVHGSTGERAITE